MIAPKIRFPEFHGEYVNDSLSEISDRVRRKNSDNQTDIPLTIASIEGLVDQRTYFGKTVASKDMSGYYLLQNGEFAYNKSYSKGFPVGSIKRLDKYAQGALSTLYICFALKDDADVTSDYLVQYFNSPAWYEAVNEVCAEGARNHGLLNVSPDDFFATTHHFAPTKEEQDKVAAFLSLYDQKIENQMAKVEALEIRRKGLLQQIFSQEIRFKADDGSEFPDWEEASLESITEKVERKAPKDSTAPVMMISQGKGFIYQSEKYSQDNAGQSLKNYTLLKRNEMAYNHGASKAKPFGVTYSLLTEGEARVPFVYHTFRMLNGYPDFWNYALNTEYIDRQLKGLVSSSVRSNGLLNINYDTYMGITVLVPCDEEQKKISEFLMLIDKQVQLEKDKLEAIKQVKKGLLQQMFV